eukprot:TRINITY_DN788_c0_g2_i1.p1 TRINITY_DN788_c0_g2~~TRINITY_DN788_c0_g2_i1.p1  ORF type:complete len:681 (+),score=174.67 TRINITY_DN788_c0_g2_i1:85-2127(+)
MPFVSFVFCSLFWRIQLTVIASVVMDSSSLRLGLLGASCLAAGSLLSAESSNAFVAAGTRSTGALRGTACQAGRTSESSQACRDSSSSSTSAALCGGVAALAAAACRRQRTGADAVSARAFSQKDAEEKPARDKTKRRAKTVVATGTETKVTDVDPSAGPKGTYNVGIDFKNWLVSCEEEVKAPKLNVEGSLPPWLQGSLVHAGPAKFEFGGESFVDWVDGQAMLYRVMINEKGECEYQNKWLDTVNHRKHREAGRIAVRETCSRPALPTLTERLAYMTTPPENENANLHISQIAQSKRSISLSVGSSPVEFNMADLSTVGRLTFDDEIAEGGPLIFHAEPFVDPVTGEWITVAIQLFPRPGEGPDGWKPEYVLFSIPPEASTTPGAPLKRRTILRIPTETPSPVHTISVTENYVVFIQIPYPLNWDGMLNAEGKWLWTGKYDGNLMDYNSWVPELGTEIHVVNRHTGEYTKSFKTDPWFFFHQVNAYEEGSDIKLDVVTYKEPPVGFPLEQARYGDVEDWRGGGGEVRRFHMNLESGDIRFDRWRDNCFDEPKINHKLAGSKYRYSYGVQDDNGMLRLVKLDHELNTVKYWEGQDVTRELPWQPVFTAQPYSDKEDAGVLLSFVRDQPTGNTFCVVIDTETFEEKARIHFPEGHHVPLHGHGAFFQGQYEGTFGTTPSK